MKQMMIFGVIAIGLGALGCNKVRNIADINVDIPYSTQITVPDIGEGGAPIPGQGATLDFPAVAVETNSKQYLTQYHTNSDNILKVDLKSLSMEIVMPPSQNFDFLDTMQLYISAGTLPEVMVAYTYNIPKGMNILHFITITDVNLKDYFIADTMRLHMRAHINAVPATGTQLNIASVFHMLANPLY